MKKLLRAFLITLAILVIFTPDTAAAAETDPLTPEKLAEELDTAGLTEQLNALDELLAEQGAEKLLSDTWQAVLKGEQTFSLSLLWQTLGRLVLGQLKDSAFLLKQLLILSLLAVILTILKTSFAGARVAEIGRWAVYLLLIGLAVAAFIPCLEKAEETVSMLRDMIYAVLPLLAPLLISVGGVTGAGLLDPALLFAVSLLLDVMGKLVFPLICFSAVLKLSGGMSPQVKLDKMAGLCKDVALGVMGVMSAVFIAFLGFSGIASSTADGLAAKAVKSAAGAFIPIVGRSLADAFDSVMGTALLLKNGIGLIGTAAVLVICALPSIYVLLQALMFRIAGALVQPLGEEKLADVLSGMGGSLTVLFAAMAVAGLFAFFAIALVVGMGNITMMMR